jgi:hypothetical protein
MHRLSGFPAPDRGYRGQHSRDKTFHVGDAPADELSILAAQFKWISGPALTIDRHGVDVTRKRDPARSYRADDRVQVGFFAGGIEAEPVRYIVRFQPRPDKIDEWQI